MKKSESILWKRPPIKASYRARNIVTLTDDSDPVSGSCRESSVQPSTTAGNSAMTTSTPLSRWESKKSLFSSYNLIKRSTKSRSLSKSASRSPRRSLSYSPYNSSPDTNRSSRSRSPYKRHGSKKSPLLTEGLRTSLNFDRYSSERRKESHFRGSDSLKEIDPSSLKHIVIDIRRPSVSTNKEIIRTLADPNKFTIYRRPGEGSKPLFKRDEFLRGDRREISRSPVRRARSRDYRSSSRKRSHSIRSDISRSLSRRRSRSKSYNRRSRSGSRKRSSTRRRKASRSRSRRRSRSRNRRSRSRSRSRPRRKRALIEKRYPLKRHSRSSSSEGRYRRRVEPSYEEMMALRMRTPYMYHPMHMMPYMMPPHRPMRQPMWPIIPRMPTMPRMMSRGTTAPLFQSTHGRPRF